MKFRANYAIMDKTIAAKDITMLLQAENLSINFGNRQILDNVNFYLDDGDKVGVIGINGTGKSTFLKVLAGVTEADGGRITRNPNVQISYLSQNDSMDDDHTILEHIFYAMPEDFRMINEYEAKTMLSKLGITEYNRLIGSLSGGQRKIVSLVAALIHPADILILDEPTNHLDSEMVAWLEDWLRSFRGRLIMVTHDRYFLERVCNHITELSHGKLYHYEANYSKYLELKAQRAEMAEASERKRQSILRVEREWIMRGCKARSTKSKERIQRYEDLLNREAPETEDSIKITAATSRLGRKIIELQNVRKQYDDRVIISDFSYNLLRTDRIGIVGRNGAGKSTLLHMIAGLLSPDSGIVDIGSTVKIGHFSQHGRELDLEQRVYDFIHEIASEVRSSEGILSAKQMMERFMFPSELQRMPIGKLSGGERRRLYLLSVLMEAPNVLLFDEPTNDLDVMTLSILEDYLQDFAGPIIIVSHDRFFLDKLTESIFEVHGDGRVTQFTGNWSDWAAKRLTETTPSKVEKPKQIQPRVKEKKLKFTFKEEREFQTIDDEIAKLEELIEENKRQQSVYCTDYVKLQELHDEQTSLEVQLEEKTERWFYLNDLKERIDAQ